MVYSANIVSAAIMNIADRATDEASISETDTDAYSLIMADAERTVANQLVRLGMSLKEASDLASAASMMAGRETPESVALADDAYLNRNAKVDPPVAPVQSDEAGDEDQSGADAPAAAAPTPGAPVARAAATAPRAKATTRVAPVSKGPELIPHEVVMKKVHEIFAGIDEGDMLFDFELPFVNWASRHPGIPSLDTSYVFDPAALHTVLYAIATGVSLNIVGPHGCGKTQIVHQVAARLNFPVSTLPMDGQLSRRELIGQEKLRATEDGAESYFLDGILPRAMREPGFVLFDEVDRGVSDVQYACHSVYLQEGLKILEDGDRWVPFHAYNRVFATANTKGRGSMDGMYQPPEEMSEATRDRWSLWLDMDYPPVDWDQTILSKKVKGLEDEHARIIATVASQIRQSYKDGRLAQTCSMRQQLEVARMTLFMTRNEKDDVRKEKGLRMAFDRVIGGRASPEDKGAIDLLIETIIPNAFIGDPLI